MKASQPCLLIRADASPAIGSGHVMRCLALAKAWQNSGGSVRFLSAENIPALEERLESEGMAVNRISALPGSTSDAHLTASDAQRMDASWVVVDGYRFEPDYIRAVKSGGAKVLFLDDDGRFSSYPSDAVLNQNICADSAMYKNKGPLTRLLLGSEYVLLRPEFLVETETHQQPAIARNVLLTMGGSDPEKVTSKVLTALSGVKRDLEAKVVIGGGNPWYEELRSLASSLPLKVEPIRSPASMAPLMTWADVAISGAGGTCWELTYLGVPSIVIALSPDQQGIATGLAERGIAISLGWYANLSEQLIVQTLEDLMADYDQRCAMSERGRKLVDGRGAERVVEFLKISL